VTRSERGYFSLTVNEYGRINEIEVLGQSSLSHITNYLSLYNIHEKYLNSLLQRFNDHMITDFFE
jgi:hypothetical protein